MVVIPRHVSRLFPQLQKDREDEKQRAQWDVTCEVGTRTVPLFPLTRNKLQRQTQDKIGAEDKALCLLSKFVELDCPWSLDHVYPNSRTPHARTIERCLTMCIVQTDFWFERSEVPQCLSYIKLSDIYPRGRRSSLT